MFSTLLEHPKFCLSEGWGRTGGSVMLSLWFYAIIPKTNAYLTSTAFCRHGARFLIIVSLVQRNHVIYILATMFLSIERRWLFCFLFMWRENVVESWFMEVLGCWWVCLCLVICSDSVFQCISWQQISGPLSHVIRLDTKISHSVAFCVS